MWCMDPSVFHVHCVQYITRLGILKILSCLHAGMHIHGNHTVLLDRMDGNYLHSPDGQLMVVLDSNFYTQFTTAILQDFLLKSSAIASFWCQHEGATENPVQRNIIVSFWWLLPLQINDSWKHFWLLLHSVTELMNGRWSLLKICGRIVQEKMCSIMWPLPQELFIL